MDATNVSNVLATQLTSSALVVWIIQRLKSWKWFSWLQPGSPIRSRVFSVIGSLLTTLGISYSWSPAQNNSHQLVFLIPSATVLLVGVWHMMQSFVLNETIYQCTVNKISVTSTPVGPVAPAKITSEGQVVVPKAGQ